MPKLDFITSAGHLTGGDARARLKIPGKGPVAVITDLCIMEPDPVTRELTVVSIHAGITPEQIRAATGWPVLFAANVRQTPDPSALELDTLRALQQRTAVAHGTASSSE